MTDQWHAGVLTSSSWHGLEVVETIPDAATLIRRGEELGAYPTAVGTVAMRTVDGLDVPGAAVVATYADGTRTAHAAVGRRYTPLDPREWRRTIEAAVEAGARPAGAFALRGGSRVLATFEIDRDDDAGTRSYLNLADSFDGSTQVISGGSTVRVVCANTVAAWLGQDGAAAAKIRHTASVNDRAEVLRKAIVGHIREGQAVAELYKAARDRTMARDEVDAVWDALFPRPTEEVRKASKRTANRMERARVEATKAARRAENWQGRTLASLWNAATWVIDRDADGGPRKVRGNGSMLDSMLFGSRGKRVAEVRKLVEVVLADGTVEAVEESSPLAVEAYASTGRALLADMLD